MMSFILSILYHRKNILDIHNHQMIHLVIECNKHNYHLFCPAILAPVGTVVDIAAAVAVDTARRGHVPRDVVVACARRS